MTDTDVPRWKNRGTRHMAECFAADQERLNALADRLSVKGPGRWRQKDAIRYLLDFHEENTAATEAGS